MAWCSVRCSGGLSGRGVIMIITITAGHGGKDSGVVFENTKEADFCADMRNYVAYYLRNWGYTVLTDGEGRVNAPLAQAIQLAKQANIAVEFHLNAAANHSVFGIEVLTRDKHKPLAQAIAQAIQSVTKSTLRGDKGFKPEDAGQHSRLGFVSAGGLIVELEFLTNTARFGTLNTHRWTVAKAIAEAIKEYIDK